MSQLKVNTIRNTAGKDIAGVSGTIVDTYYTTSSSSHMVLTNYNNNGTRVPDLTLVIKPKATNNIIICEWSVYNEVYNDNVWLIHKRVNYGSWGLVTTGGEEGYNSAAGNQYWSGISMPRYDVDFNSTPHTQNIQYHFVANTTNTVEIALALRCSGANQYNCPINRTQGSWGQTSYENGTSYAWLYEIKA